MDILCHGSVGQSLTSQSRSWGLVPGQGVVSRRDIS